MVDFEEMRKSLRKRLLKDGKITATPPSGTIDVRIRNPSGTGARLEINAKYALRAEFELMVVSART